MSVATFIPQVWEARLLENLKSAHVYVNLLNRDYEGTISQKGDTVHINSVGTVTIKDYTKNADIAAPEDISTADQTLVVDQAKYYNFSIDDIDKRQAAGNLVDPTMAEAADALASVQDAYVAGLLKAGTAAIGNDTTPIAINKDNAYDQLVDLFTLLTKRKLPKAGRWVVLPPEYVGLLSKDTRFVGTGSASAEDILKNGFRGKAAGFDVYESNDVPNTAGEKYKVIAGHPICATYAEQMTKTEAYRPEGRFSDAVKGLAVFGAKVTRPTCIGVLTCNF
jgi:N4-gp56 family major capsid protein